MRQFTRGIVSIGSVLVVLALSEGGTRGDSIVASNMPSNYQFSSNDLGIGFTGSTSNGFFSNETPAQEFTAQSGGILTKLVTAVGQFQAEGVSLNVTIAEVSGTTPGTSLGTVVFSPSQVSSNVFNSLSTLDLSSANIDLVKGQSYFVIFSVDTPIAGSVRYQAILLQPNSSFFGFPALDSPNGGSTWNAINTIPNNEIGLTVYANAVPEPSTIVGAVTALVIGIGYQWQRRRKRTRIAA
jgi:hypothetical protein